MSKESTVSETHTERTREMRKMEEVEIGNRKREGGGREGERDGDGVGSKSPRNDYYYRLQQYHRLWVMLRLKRAKHLSFVSLNSTVPWWGPILSHRVLILSVISGAAECSIFHHLQA